MSLEAREGAAGPSGSRNLSSLPISLEHSLLPILKPATKDHRPVQDLREVNKHVETIHPKVPNPYTLLSLLLSEQQFYTVLNLKDAFFSIPLAPANPSLPLNGLTPKKGSWAS